MIGDNCVVMAEVETELRRASQIAPPFASAHEGYAIILEELDELKEEVWKRVRDRNKMRKEAVQVAAMAIRFALDVCSEKPETCCSNCGKGPEEHNTERFTRKLYCREGIGYYYAAPRQRCKCEGHCNLEGLLS